MSLVLAVYMVRGWRKFNIEKYRNVLKSTLVRELDSLFFYVCPYYCSTPDLILRCVWVCFGCNKTVQVVTCGHV